MFHARQCMVLLDRLLTEQDPIHTLYEVYTYLTFTSTISA